MASPLRFGGVFEVDPEAGELRKHGLRIRLAEQPFSILLVLLGRPGQVITRDELQRQLWSADTFVDFERGLNKAMNRLRDALGDSADEPRFIETLPKRGYRFIGHVEPRETTSSELLVGENREPLVGGHSASGAGKQSESRVDRTRLRYLAAAAAVLVIVASIALVYTRRSPAIENLVRSSLLPPPNTSFLPYNFALSPDGTHLAFVAEGAGQQLLWVRSLSAANAQPLNGTDGASFPFWAPDNHQVGFFADRRLKTVDIAGGAVRTIADVKRPSGGSWSSEGVIVFAPDVSGPLYRVPDTGGEPTPVTSISNAEETQRWPFFLPDGRHFLYVADNSNRGGEAHGIFAGSVDASASTHVSPDAGRNAVFALNRVFVVRGGTLTAQPFDLARLQTIGQPTSVAEREVAVASAFFPSGFSISNTGLLAFQSSIDLSSRLTWMDAAGREIDALPEGAYSDPSVSPDGRRVAMSCDQLGNGTSAICVYDSARRVVARVTTGTSDRFPVWSPDGTEIAYASRTGSYRVASDGSTAPQPVPTRNNPSSWSGGGQILSFGTDTGIVSLGVTSLVDHHVTDLGVGSEGQFSPDGRWIAHNGPDGIVIRRFPGPGARVQVSGYGGHQPRWSRNGTQLFYISRDKALMAVDFDPATVTASAPRVLFRTRIVAAAFIGFQYDVAPDGRFIVNARQSASPPLTLLTGWAAALKQ